jgi:hypothetical protein
MTTPTKTADTRVFLIDGRARGDHKPSYESTMRMMGVSQGFGDVERIENPDPYEYGKFIEVGEVVGAIERATTSLEGRYARAMISELLTLARKGCMVDAQLHMGACTDPSDFNTYDKALILEKARLTNYSTEDLGALASGDNAVVNETVDLSASQVYEIVPLSYGVKAGSLITNEIVDAALCDSASCGDCETESNGCQKIFAVSKAAGGSPTTPSDIVFTIDGGVVWYAHDVDTLGIAEDPSGVDCLGVYIVVVSAASNSLHYALLSEFDGLIDPTFTEVATGFVAGGEPQAIFTIGGRSYIVGNGGYIYYTEDPTAGVTVLDAGSLTTASLLDVAALSEENVVAVGQAGNVLYSENGETFAHAAKEFGAAVNLNCVAIKPSNAREWWVGTSTGRVYYTLNSGAHWTEKAFPGSGSGVVYDIEFATDSEVFIAHATAANAGRILRSIDGGYSWKVTPEKSGAVLPANDKLNVLVTCKNDPNFVAGFGLADNGADGFAVIGKGS